MSIEINGSGGRPPVEITENRNTAAPSAKGSSINNTAVNSSGDKLSLTSEATQLKMLEEQISNLPIIDTQRVVEVQRSLATGSFQIDPASVADKMLQFEAALGSDK